MRIAAWIAFIGWTLLVAIFFLLGTGSFSIYHVLFFLAPGWLVAGVLRAFGRRK